MPDLADLPSRNPLLFSRLQQGKPRGLAPAHKEHLPQTYLALHDRTEAPAGQVVSNEATSILIREFYRIGLQQVTPSKKRATPEPDQHRHSKYPRHACSYEGSYQNIQSH
ncbi:hypothetical protein WJX72_004185 [[Myrmecia] bisecta]|uniref:DET1- and DDB1-associated protein 1 domain-containing protein n=1 Tax=[Myrmecia] bisecta TaxID=41462 RepID=A0AAW1QEU7_9CHLO